MPEATLEQAAPPKAAAVSLDDHHACCANVQNFLGAAAQSHPDFVTMQSYLAQAQGNPELAPGLLTQMQALQTQIFSADRAQAAGNLALSKLQEANIPVTKVDVNFGGTAAEPTIALVLGIEHNNEENYYKIIPAAKATLAQAFPVLNDLQPANEGTWHADREYKLEYKIPENTKSPDVTTAMLHGKSLAEGKEIQSRIDAVNAVGAGSGLAAAGDMAPALVVGDTAVVKAPVAAATADVHCGDVIINNAHEVVATGGEGGGSIAAPKGDDVLTIKVPATLAEAEGRTFARADLKPQINPASITPDAVTDREPVVAGR